jgi:transcriptional regulator with XRE-family HTH domain
MLTATLGGLIKDYRIKKRLSQLEVSLKIGWKDTSRLSKIEQGRVGNPTRETIEKIMGALELSDGEKADMLMAGSIIPTKEEAVKTLRRLEKYLKSIHFPVVLIDFAWNVYFFNPLARELYQLTEGEYKQIIQENLNWFDLLFGYDFLNKVEIRGGYSKEELISFKQYNMEYFKYDHAGSIGERWFQKLLASLSSKSEEFRELWNETKPSKEDHFHDYEINEFSGIWKAKKRKLTFHVYSVRPAFDFRFIFLIHQSADEETSKFY